MEKIFYKNARVPTGLTDFNSDSPLVDCHILVAQGVIENVFPSSTILEETSLLVEDLKSSVVLPGFVDAHVHLDKAFSWERAPNVRGEFWDAIALLAKDKENWSAEDLYQRGTFALRCAEAHGTVAMRTHVDTELDFGAVSHEAMHALRKEWAGRLDLQTVSLCMLEDYRKPAGKKMAEMTLQYPNALLGGMPQMNPDLDKQLDYFFDLAKDMQANVDLHVDENGDPAAECLRHVAETVLRKEFPYSVTCGHVCSLAVQDPARALSTIELVKQAGIEIISLPLCNLYLQGRRDEHGRRATPQWRGITLLHEMIAAGISPACASDNVRDAFYAWGDFDMFEVFIQGLRIAHLDTLPQEACQMVTTNPARIMGHPHFGKIQPGNDARLIAFEATSLNELLSRPAQKRRLLGYHSAAAEVPSYRELGKMQMTP